MKKGALKDIITIVVKLTVTCLVAGIIMGAAFLLTHEAKEHNEQVRDERVMLSILGYDKKHPAPKTLSLNTIYRYIVTRGETQSIGYVLSSESGTQFVELDLDGKFLKAYPIAQEIDKLRKEGDRTGAVQALISDGEVRYADNFIIAVNNGERVAYILDGRYPGFKASIHVKMALGADYSMLGFEVLEHEEDPGLGAEIKQEWFRGQFEGKSFEQLKTTGVVRSPMPDDFRSAITGKIKGEDADKIRKEHSGDDIYALTGATISSRSVLNGNKAMVTKFVYRIEILDKVLQQQGIKTPF